MQPNEVPIHLTLNLDQINLILEGLGGLPYSRAEQIVLTIRSSTLAQLKEAEKRALAVAESETASA